MKNHFYIFLLVSLGIILAACTGPGPDDLTGGGTETETYGIIGSIVKGDGLPAEDAWVRIRPLTHIPGDKLEGPIDSVYTTDTNGRFAISGLEESWYSIIARDTAGKALCNFLNLSKSTTADSIYLMMPDTLRPTGKMNGVVRFPATFPLDKIDLALQGLDLDRVQATDSLPEFSLDSIPAGSYTLLSVPLAPVSGATFPRFAGIDIHPDSTTVVDTIDLGFLDSLSTSERKTQ